MNGPRSRVWVTDEDLGVNPSSDHDHCEIVVTQDFNGEPVGTIFFDGFPVLVVAAEGVMPYEYHWLEYHYDTASYGNQCIVGFLHAIGEASEDMQQRLVDHPQQSVMQAIADADNYGDGHELIAAVGRVAWAIHDTFPNRTPDPSAQGWVREPRP